MSQAWRIYGYDPYAFTYETGTGTPFLGLLDATIPQGVNLGTLTSATFVIDATGTNVFNLNLASDNYSVSAVVDLANNSYWIGTVNSVRADFITVDGGYNSAFVNNGSSNVFGADITINTAVQGTGNFLLTRDRGATGEVIFNGAVGQHQTAILESGDAGSVTLNNPKAFAGLLEFVKYSGEYGDSGEININNIGGTAAFYSFRNDMLAIYNSRGQVLDMTRLQSADAFSVEKIGRAHV